MKAALRVLTALSERQKPDQGDIDELYWYAPSDRQRPIDELVCDAIQRALQEREQRRKAAAQLRERGLMFSPAEEETASATTGPASQEQRLEIQRLIREHSERRQAYLALSAKLKRLGLALQQAAANLVEADAGGYSANSEAAREVLAPVAGEVDLSGITQLLNDHVRLTRLLVADQQTLKKHGIE